MEGNYGRMNFMMMIRPEYNRKKDQRITVVLV